MTNFEEVLIRAKLVFTKMSGEVQTIFLTKFLCKDGFGFL